MTPKQKAEAERLHACGTSLRSIAEAVGVPHVSVYRYLKKVGAAPVAAAPVDVMALPYEPDVVPAPAASVEPPPDPGDTLAFARRMMAECRQLAEQARAAGNYAAAQKAARDSGHYTLIVARLEKAAHADADVVRVPRAEVDAIRDVVRGRIEAIMSRPLHCAKCSRELSIQWGTQPETETDG